MAIPSDARGHVETNFALGGLGVAIVALACTGWIWVNHDWSGPAPQPLPPPAPPFVTAFVPAVLDMSRIFAANPLTKDAEARLIAGREVAESEMDRRLSARQQWLDLASDATQRMQRAGLSYAEWQDQSNERERFVGEVRTLDGEIAALETSHERELQQEDASLRRGIFAQINATALAIARQRGVSVLFDSSGLSGVPVVFTAPSVLDLTDEVIAALAADAQTSER